MGRANAQAAAMNEALLIAGLRQHELREIAERLNEQLRNEITQRERTEKRVRLSETRFRRLFEAAEVGILILDPGTRKITDANPFMTTLLGYPRDELVCKELWEIGLLGDEELSKAAFLNLRERGIIRYENLPLLTRRGQPIQVELVGNLYEEEGRELIQCNIRDISQRRSAEAEAGAARHAAEKANHAKDDFLAALSHELRTPLNPILLLATEAAENPAVPANLRADFETIVKNVMLEARLIDDLLDSTRIAHGKLVLEMGPLLVNEVMQEAIAHVQSEIAGKHLNLKIDLAPSNPCVVGDPMRLQQIFWNVLKNAVKFTNDDGHLTVRTTTDSAAGRLVVEIQDTGVGMTAGEIERIFEAFAQGDHAGRGGSHKFGGLGLGLAISRSLVELHSGTIRAASDGIGCGALFTIELPLAAPLTLREPKASALPPPSPKAKEEQAQSRILLVEDHEPTREALRRLLIARKHVVSTAATIAEARKLGTSATFDLLITDIGLPDGNGHDLMEELSRLRGPKGIAMTGYGMEEDIEHSKRVGFIAHLTKPVRIQTLDAALHLALKPPSPASVAS